MTISSSELFTRVTKRNALRRSSGLPLLNVREEIAKEAYTEAMSHYRAGLARFKPQVDAIRRAVLADLQSQHGEGFGRGLPDRTLIAQHATPIVRALLASKGYPFPERNPYDPIVYGQDKPEHIDG